jgi:hypothetical protein
MKRVLRAEVPPTKNAGSCKISGFCSLYETAKQNILWSYNKMLQQDGFKPVKKMPAGTKYKLMAGFGML